MGEMNERSGPDEVEGQKNFWWHLVSQSVSIPGDAIPGPWEQVAKLR